MARTALQYILSIAIDQLKYLGMGYIFRIISKPRSKTTTMLLFGAFSGVCTRVATGPLDVLKIRLQLQLEAITKVSEFKICTYIQITVYINFVVFRAVTQNTRELFRQLRR